MTDDERKAARKLGEAEFSTLFSEAISEADGWEVALLGYWKRGLDSSLGAAIDQLYTQYCHRVLQSQEIVQSAPYDDEE